MGIKAMIAASLAAAALMSSVAFADERPYTDGSVWNVALIRTTDGMGDEYLASLGKNYKPIMDEAQKQGLILSWKIISVPYSGTDDWDLMLMTEYKNWAALDGQSEKYEAIARKLISKKDEDKLMEQRLQVRRFVSERTGQELKLK